MTFTQRTKGTYEAKGTGKGKQPIETYQNKNTIMDLFFSVRRQ